MQGLRTSVWIALLAAGAGLVACAAAKPPEVAPTGSTTSRSGPPTPVPTTTSTFGCGATTCTAGEQICCGGDAADAACVPKPAPNPDGQAYRAAMVEACTAAQAPPQELSECDGSDDCAGGTVCCVRETGFIDSASVGFVACVSRSTCVAPEVCSTEGAPCGDGTSVCIGGACRRPAQMRCGSETCSVSKPFCCVGEDVASATCGTHEECEAAERFPQACMEAGDCAPGNFCQRPTMAPEAGCVGRLDTANMVTLCQRDEDCAPACGAGPEAVRGACDDTGSCACP